MRIKTEKLNASGQPSQSDHPMFDDVDFETQAFADDDFNPDDLDFFLDDASSASESATRPCPECGTTLPIDAMDCPECGCLILDDAVDLDAAAKEPEPDWENIAGEPTSDFFTAPIEDPYASAPQDDFSYLFENNPAQVPPTQDTSNNKMWRNAADAERLARMRTNR